MRKTTEPRAKVRLDRFQPPTTLANAARQSYPSPSVSPQSRTVELVDDERSCALSHARPHAPANARASPPSFSSRCASPECFDEAFPSADAGPVPAGALFGAMPTTPLFRAPSPSPSIASSLNRLLFGRDSPELEEGEVVEADDSDDDIVVVEESYRPARVDKGKGRCVAPLPAARTPPTSEPVKDDSRIDIDEDTIHLVPVPSPAPRLAAAPQQPALTPSRHPWPTSVCALRDADRARGLQGPFSFHRAAVDFEGKRKAMEVEVQLTMLALGLGPAQPKDVAEREAEFTRLVLGLGPAPAQDAMDVDEEVDELEDDE